MTNIVKAENRLALFGGSKAINEPFEAYNTMGREEKEAAKSVIESGVLSKYLGTWSKDFYGGIKVNEFERYCENYFRVKHAVSVNSWTSGLTAAVGAVGIEPGDEVIVTPWTMCASATAILHWNAIPVFADIEPDTFCIDPKSVVANISPYTKAIMSVDIFGQSADIDTLKNIAQKYNLKLILDSAQAPGAHYKGVPAGTGGDVGGFSLNYHKHIHTGEGGIIVTNDDKIAERLRLIRNHAEAVVEGMGCNDLSNMIGYNYRLGEIECAIGIEQLRKLDGLILRRQQVARKLSKKLAELRGLKAPEVRNGCSHIYYIFPIIVDTELLGVARNKIAEALKAEGIHGLAEGYVNVHRLPMYQKKIAYGSGGFPWSSEICKRDVSYAKGICPVAEKLHDKTFLSFPLCLFELSNDQIDMVAKAFYKVWENMDLLKDKP